MRWYPCLSMMHAFGAGDYIYRISKNDRMDWLVLDRLGPNGWHQLHYLPVKMDAEDKLIETLKAYATVLNSILGGSQ